MKSKREIPENSTPIINSIIEKLARSKFKQYEFNLIMAIVRKTYGWDKKSDFIAGTQLEKLTGIPRHHCYRTILGLVKMKVLIKSDKNLGINKNVDQWEVEDRFSSDNKIEIKKVPDEVYSSKENIPDEVSKYTSRGIKNIPHQVPTKENKKTITKEIKKINKKRFGEFQNVHLRDDEYLKLLEKWGKGFTDNLIEDMSTWLKSKGKRYKDHYAALLNWGKKAKSNSKTRNITITSKMP